VGRSFLHWLDQWLATIRSIGNPWGVTVVCVGLFLIGANAGMFNVSPSSVSAIREGQDIWRAFRFALWDALTSLLFFGLIAIPVVLWDKWWLTGPAVIGYAVIVLPTILQDIMVVFATLGVIAMRPLQLVPILGIACAKLAGDALVVVYLALPVRALLT